MIFCPDTNEYTAFIIAPCANEPEFAVIDVIDDLEPATSNSYVPVLGTVQTWYPWKEPVVKFALLVTQDAEPEYEASNAASVGPDLPIVFALVNVNVLNGYIDGNSVVVGVIVGVGVAWVLVGVTVNPGVTVAVTVEVGVAVKVGVGVGVGCIALIYAGASPLSTVGTLNRVVIS